MLRESLGSQEKKERKVRELSVSQDIESIGYTHQGELHTGTKGEACRWATWQKLTTVKDSAITGDLQPEFQNLVCYSS